MLGLGLSLTTGGVATPAYVALAKAFVTRVEADGGTVESFACLKTDMAYLTSNPAAPAGYTAEWSAATVGSSAEFRINLVGGAGYTYTYAVTDSQATEVTGTGVMGGNIQAVTADLSTLVDGTVTLAVYLTGAGGDGLVVTDTATLVGYTGLLDTYSGAAAAYSLRLLNTSYTGDAIVVRRSSDNTTQNIGFVNNELDTASLESFCSGTDGFVTTWYDQSGNGNDAAQASASKQPKIVGNGNTLTKGTKPALEFNSSPYLTSSSFSSPISQTTGFIVFDSAQGDFLFDDIVTINTNSLYLNSSNEIRLYTNNAPTAIYHSISPNTWPQYAIASFVSDTTNSLIGINNATTAGTIGVATMQGVTLGAARAGVVPLGGYLQEVIVYGSNKSSDLSGINTNINDFYSIY